jgi:hypothetical protein
MRVRGYYGTMYEIPDEDPFPAIDQHLSTLRKNFPEMTDHPDINTLLDKRSDLMKERVSHED